MRGKLTVSAFTPIAPELRQQITTIIETLLDKGQEERKELISELLALFVKGDSGDLDMQQYCEYCGVIIEKLVAMLSGAHCSERSPLFEFLDLLHHIPLRDSSERHQNTVAILKSLPYCDEAFIEQLKRAQVLYLLTQLGDFDTSALLLEDFSTPIDPECTGLYILYHLSFGRILQHQRRYQESITLWLNLISEMFVRDSSETACYFIIRWLQLIDWGGNTLLKKALLLNLAEEFSQQKHLNSALVLYELFSLEDRLVSPPEKIHYARRLIKHPPSLLSVMQLQNVHFFAGNYISGMQSSFRESIQYFKYSNYFLHKCWDYHRQLSTYLRENLSPELYLRCIPYLEDRTQELGSQVSMQNNSYVETLQADYNKIEQLYQQVEELSITDVLTGLRNRRYLEANLSQMFMLAARHQVPVCFAMLDIDHFKLVNDTLGHPAGDYVLKELALLVSKGFRKSDVILRYGGEEFLIILFDSTPQLTFTFMEELRKEVEEHHFEFRNHPISITVSIGMVCSTSFTLTDKEVARYIAKADSALYKAKNAGRNRVMSTQ